MLKAALHYQSFSSKSLVTVYTIKVVQSSRFWKEILITSSYLQGIDPFDEQYCAFLICILCYMIIRRLGTRQKSLWTSDWLCRCPQSSEYHATSLQELTQLILQSFVRVFLPNVSVYFFTFTCINSVNGF